MQTSFLFSSVLSRAAAVLALGALSACQTQAPPTGNAPLLLSPQARTPGAGPVAQSLSPLQNARPFAEITSFQQNGETPRELGQLQMEIAWPEPDFAIQVIPSSTASLRVRISGGNQPETVETVQRPAGSVIAVYRLIFLSLPSGSNRRIEVEALDSSGRPVARGVAANVSILPQQFNRQRITLSPVALPTPTPTPSPTATPRSGGGGGGGGGATNRAPVVAGINQALSLSGGNYQGSVSVAASDPEGRALSYVWSATAGTFSNATTAQPGWSGPPGTHTFSVQVSDGVNTTSYSQQLALTPDQPPVVSALTDHLSLSSDGYAGSLAVSASDPENQPLSYAWSATAGTFSNATTAQPGWSGPPGTHTFSVQVSDGVNTTSYLRTLTLAGNSPPVVAGLNQALALDGNNYAGTVTVVASDPEADPLSYSWSATAGSFANNGSAQASWSGPAGTHTFTVVISDGVNSVTYAQDLTLTANQAPQVSAITPALSFANNGYSGTLTAVATDPEAASLNYSWSATAGSFANNGSAQASWSGPPGTHTFTVQVSDGANTTTFARTLTLAANLPPVVSGLNQSLSLNGNSYQGTVSAVASDPEGVPLSYTWSATAGSFANNGSAQASWSGPAGTHRFTVVVSDGFNSVSYGQDLTLSANQAPLIGSLQADMNFVGPGHGGSLQALNVSDPDNDTLSYTWRVPAGTLGSAQQAQTTWTQVPSGSYTVALDVSDGFNTTTRTLQVPLANQLPLITGINTGGITETSAGVHTGNLSVSASDPEGQPLSYLWSFSRGSITSSVSANPVSWSSLLQSAVDQTYTATVTVSDGQTSQSYSQNFSLHNNQAPQVDGIQASVSETGVNQFNGSLSVSASDPENDSLSYTWIDDPNTSVLQSLTGATVQLKANTPPGSYTVQVRASDGRLSSTALSRELVLSTQNLPPVIDSLTRSLSHAAGVHSGTLGATVSDPESRSLSYQWRFVGASNGAVLTQDTSLTPGFSGPQGSYTLRLTVTDSSVAPTQVVSRDLSFTLTNPNLAPSVSAITPGTPSYSAQTGQHQVALTAVASDPEAQPLSYVWSTTGGSLSASSGNPVTLSAPAGTYTVSVQASDGVNLSPVQTRQVVFTNPNRAPVITGVTPNVTLASGVYGGSLSVQGSDPDNDSLSYTWTVLNGGSSLGASTGQNVSWSAAPGTHRVQVVASDGQTNSAPYVFETTLQANQAPLISGIEVDPSLYLLNGLYQRNLTATATDPENAPLTYSWSVTQGSPAGSFYTAPTPPAQASNTLNSTARTVGYRAQGLTPYVVQVQVSDGTQISTYSRSVLLGNNAPYVSSVNYTVSCAGNGAYTVPLTLNVLDPENHPITGVDWSVNRGSLSVGTTLQKTWTIPSAGTHTLTLKLSDAYSSNTSTLNLSVGGCP